MRLKSDYQTLSLSRILTNVLPCLKNGDLKFLFLLQGEGK